ncbi:tetratricopeptide repeat protein [Rubellimicrobium rubrum]|uniref:Tetratricopeptide repeat protein n=2 Tax=Rubellimicrobium rubrum TaxID=2585369 RepID=A0A5C4MPQ6_9RHOB|nr:tetratricopeptide repeat protein [Rubellimicrobium rubrum]
MLALLSLAACGNAGLNRAAGGIYAPGLASGQEADPLETGHRLMKSGEFQLALDAYMRAAAKEGLTPDTLAGMGTANLRLGRLGQAEDLLRRSVKEDPMFVSAWNNLGVLLMEQDKYGEASEVFRRAYAADSGNSDTIRDNLRTALVRMDDPFYTGINETEEVRTVGYGEERPLTAEEALLAIEPL